MTTYYFTDTASDLTGGNDFSNLLSDTSGTAGSQGVSISRTDTEDSYAWTAAGVPGANGTTGNFSTEVDIEAGDSGTYLSVAWARVNSSGTQQAISSFTSEQVCTAGVKTFSATSVNLGTWATGDRLRVTYRFRGTSAHSTVNMTLGANDTDSETVAPWTIDPNGSVTVPSGANVTFAGVNPDLTAITNIAATAQGAVIAFAAVAPTVDGGSSGNGDVTAVPATFSLAAPAPTVAGDATVVATPASMTFAAVAPTITTGANVVAPAGDVTLSATAPALTTGAQVVAPAGDVTLASTAPAVSGGATVTAPASGVTFAAPAATLTTGANVTAPAASMTFAAGTPSVVGEAGGDGTVVAVPATFTMAGVAPDLTAVVVLSAASQGANVTFAAVAPTVDGGAGSANVDAVPATMSFAAVAPTITVETVVATTGPAEFSFSAAAPVVTGSSNAEVVAVPATFSLSAPAPTVEATTDGWVVAPAAGLTFSTVAPTVTGIQSPTVVAPAAVLYFNASRPLISVESGSARWLLTNPVYEDMAGVRPPFPRFKRNVGVTLVIKDGVVTEYISPTQKTLAEADSYYLGGHENYVEGDDVSILENAGYTLTPV